jgi:hydroxymethylpyrimidine pyrophosphatase-like HAD family hydrolase
MARNGHACKPDREPRHARHAARRIQIALAAPGESLLLCDLDGTLIEPESVASSDGMIRSIRDGALALRGLRERGVRIGVVTERPARSCASWLVALSHAAGYDDLFDGVVIAEGGGVVRHPAAEGHPHRWIQCTSQRAMVALEHAADYLKDAIVPLPNTDGWGLLDGLDPTIGTLVRWPDGEEVCEVSLCLYERGPCLADDPAFATQYAAVAARVDALLRRAGITDLALTEAGNGTLRVGLRNIHKGRLFGLLAGLGLLDPVRTVFIGDGLNDLPLALRLQSAGGSVVAVANAVPELQRLANWISPARADLGVAQMVEMALGSSCTPEAG